MSKKLLPVLMVMAFAAAAVAGDMSYTVYGKLHLSMQMNNDSENSQLSMSSNASRFGLKGSQDLTDNYAVIWQFEQEFDANDKGGELATRNTYIGMKGNWGSWLIGIHDTPMKLLGRMVTYFEDTVGDFRTTTLGWDQRPGDVIMYMLPKLENWCGSAMFRFDQNDAGADEAANAFGAMLGYTYESLFLGAAYESWTAGNFYEAEVGYGEAASAVRIAGNYDAEKFGISALFQTVSNAFGVEDLAQQTIGGEVLFKASPEWNLKANYYMADPDTDTDDNEFSQVAFGIDRVYGPDVTVYLQFAMMMNGDGINAGLGENSTPDGEFSWGNSWGDNVPAFAVGESPWSLGLGLWKKF